MTPATHQPGKPPTRPQPQLWNPGMGIAFALGVVVSAFSRSRRRSGWRVLDRAIQRLMFGIAYLWYAVEAVRTIRQRASARHTPHPTEWVRKTSL